jgi:hypothetical protein
MSWSIVQNYLQDQARRESDAPAKIRVIGEGDGAPPPACPHCQDGAAPRLGSYTCEKCGADWVDSHDDAQ